jgi:hypothetical protein
MSDMRWSNNSSRIRFEVKLVTNGNLKRLLLVQRFAEGTNFWVHDNGTYSYVPTEMEIETLKMTYEAIDNYNREQIFKRNVKPSS